jgi:hypothetical protein
MSPSGVARLMLFSHLGQGPSICPTVAPYYHTMGKIIGISSRLGCRARRPVPLTWVGVNHRMSGVVWIGPTGAHRQSGV